MTLQEKALLKLWKRLTPGARKNHMEQIREDVSRAEEIAAYYATLPSEEDRIQFDSLDSWICAAQEQAAQGAVLASLDWAGVGLGFLNRTTGKWNVIPVHCVTATKPKETDSKLWSLYEQIRTSTGRRVLFPDRAKGYVSEENKETVKGFFDALSDRSGAKDD